MPPPTLADVLWLVAANGYDRRQRADQRLWDRVVRVRDLNGMTRLICAASTGDAVRVACELRHGADPSLRDIEESTALDLTLWRTRVWDPTSPQPVGYEACALQLIAAMVARGAAITPSPYFPGWTAMRGALHHRRNRVLDALLAAGVSPSAVIFGRTPLYWALCNHFTASVSRLLAAGATDVENALRVTLEFAGSIEKYASKCGPVVTALLDAGAAIGAKDYIIMPSSVFKPGFPLLRLLNTARVAADGRLMRVVATVAIQESRQDVLGYLLREMQANSRMYIPGDPVVWTLLRLAAQCDNLSAANTLLDSGADVNAVSGEDDEDEDTALGEALARGHDDMADLLRRRGATE